MENASNALIMAGSVLIAIMIIGALLLMFNGLSSYQKTDTQTAREAQVIEFNNQYETYNRNNVRGSDLVSLLNKVIDYNTRKSSSGTEGQDIAYEPMSITINFKNNFEGFYIDEKQPHLIDENIEVTNTDNSFKTDIYDKIKEIEETYGADNLNNVINDYTKIFESESKDKMKENFNKVSKKQLTNQDMDTVKEEVSQYYEYVQFKRAKFNCNNQVQYDDKTGRIIGMTFEFTGKFQ